MLVNLHMGKMGIKIFYFLLFTGLVSLRIINSKWLGATIGSTTATIHMHDEWSDINDGMLIIFYLNFNFD